MEHVPETGPFITAATHVTMYDVFVPMVSLFHQGRRPRYMAKAEMAKWPLIGKWFQPVSYTHLSSRVRLQAEKEGLDKIFKDFGAEWRNAGCSMCLGMNPDKMVARERSISTSNRNFEGRQGKGSRTHLASPAVAAATAIRGTICSPADL